MIAPRQVLLRRFQAAWLDWVGHHRAGDDALALAALRRWTRHRAALESAMPIPATRAGSYPAAIVHRCDSGGAQVSIPLPASIRRELDALPGRLHLDARLGHSFRSLAAAARHSDPVRQRPALDALRAACRDLSPLASFGIQAQEPLHLALSAAAWQDFQHAAESSGIPSTRLLAALALRLWAESIAFPPGPLSPCLAIITRNAA